MSSYNNQEKGKKALLYKRQFSFLNEIDLDDITVDKKILHKNLNEKIWNNFSLDEELRQNMLKLAEQFYEFLNISAPIEDVYLTGSLANYNYTQYSDIDIHLVIDFKKVAKEKELVEDFMFTKSSLWDLTHDVYIKGFPAQLYAQDKSQKLVKTSAVFSLKDNKWIQKPKYENFEVDTETLKKKIKSVVDKIELLSKTKDAEQLFKQAEKLKNDIRKMRKSGLEKDGEFSIENLAFKYLRNNNYIDKLKETIDKTFDHIYSYK